MDTGKFLSRLTICGFKSIMELNDFELRNLNVFVGANGTGKSNLISFFKMLHRLMDDNIAGYIRENGGIGDVLYNGRKHTAEMTFSMNFGMRGYRFTVIPTANDSIVLSKEARYYKHGSTGWWQLRESNDAFSSLVKEAKSNSSDAIYSRYIYDTIMSWKIYHFHDTSSTTPMRNWQSVEDNDSLRHDASNIASFLLRLREEGKTEYREILEACQTVVPYLKEFLLKEQVYDEAVGIKKVNLSWRTKNSDFPMQPYHLSDGSIRFICLATALLQPNLPSTLIIDEPELGLHPEAIRVLGELINAAAKRTQVIVATQSPLLIDQFGIDDIIVVNRKDDRSVFERLNKNDFDKWLEDYSVGELWTKNVIQGGVCYE
jgi:predicted ATPase